MSDPPDRLSNAAIGSIYWVFRDPNCVPTVLQVKGAGCLRKPDPFVEDNVIG